MKPLIGLNIFNIIFNLICLQLLDILNDESPPVERVHIVSVLIVITQTFSLAIFSNTLHSRRFMTHTVTKIPKVLIGFLISILITYFVLIVLGAPLLENIDQTFYLSIFLTCLSVLPYLLIESSIKSRNYFSTKEASLLERVSINLFQVKDEVEFFLLLNIYSTYFGAWIGAFFLKLDWPVPWKEYPVTSIVSALVFNLFGHVCNLTIMLHRLPVQ